MGRLRKPTQHNYLNLHRGWVLNLPTPLSAKRGYRHQKHWLNRHFLWGVEVLGFSE